VDDHLVDEAHEGHLLPVGRAHHVLAAGAVAQELRGGGARRGRGIRPDRGVLPGLGAGPVPGPRPVPGARLARPDGPAPAGPALAEVDGELADGHRGLRPGGAQPRELALRLGHEPGLEQGARARERDLGLPVRGAAREVDARRPGPQRRLAEREARRAGGASHHRDEPAVAERRAVVLRARGGAGGAEEGGTVHGAAHGGRPFLGMADLRSILARRIVLDRVDPEGVDGVHS
jgi:hypothetical protein